MSAAAARLRGIGCRAQGAGRGRALERVYTYDEGTRRRGAAIARLGARRATSQRFNELSFRQRVDR